MRDNSRASAVSKHPSTEARVAGNAAAQNMHKQGHTKQHVLTGTHEPQQGGVASKHGGQR